MTLSVDELKKRAGAYAASYVQSGMLKWLMTVAGFGLMALLAGWV